MLQQNKFLSSTGKSETQFEKNDRCDPRDIIWLT